MTTDFTQTLHAIEARAERAIVQELKIMTLEVLVLRPSLTMQDRAYADGLLLKLDHLIGNQQVRPECDHPALVQNLLMTVAQPSDDMMEIASVLA